MLSAFIARVERLSSSIASWVEPWPRVIIVDAGIRLVLASPASPSLCEVTASLREDWQALLPQTPRIARETLSIEAWTVDFGDGSPVTSLPGPAHRVVARHQYVPGYYVLKIRATMAGRAYMPVSTPLMAMDGEVADRISLQLEAVATYLVSE